MLASSPGRRRDIHVERDHQTAKYWLEPVRLARSKGFKSQELNSIRKIVEENQFILRKEWNDYFESRDSGL
ncbi:MAG TPA: DUF4160 domain-containing protein [Thermoanaerobaculia bacterium]|nr:DUF4160 domain-containing protein [Thermoanaerobaculia bacterium]